MDMKIVSIGFHYQAYMQVLDDLHSRGLLTTAQHKSMLGVARAYDKLGYLQIGRYLDKHYDWTLSFFDDLKCMITIRL